MPNKEQLPGPEALSIPGEKDGQVCLISDFSRGLLTVFTGYDDQKWRCR